MDLHQKYGLRHVINACGKMTALSAAKVFPEIIEVVDESLRHFFELDHIQAAAGRVIAEATGAESGCVTACTSSGITLSVAACITGNDIGNVEQLPDTEGMHTKVVIQKGHVVNYGAPVTQAVRLAGGEVVEVGAVNKCTEAHIRHELGKGGVAAVLAVESHHTVQFGYVKLPDLVRIAHEYDVPVIVDGAAQDYRLAELVESESDLVICSAHKFLCATTGGIVAGKKRLVDAVYLQNKGIGRGMKAGKEAIFGAIAALEYRMKQDIGAWSVEQDRKVKLVLDSLGDVKGLGLDVDPDPNGCPYSRTRITPDPDTVGHTASSLAVALADGDPTIVVRAHHVDEGYFYLDTIDMTDDEIEYSCGKIRELCGG